METKKSNIIRNTLDGSEWRPKPPKWIVQNYLYPMQSLPGRPSAHASQIIAGELKDGIQKLYVVWFCGTGEGNLDVSIMLSEITYKPEEVLEFPPVEENDPFEPVKNSLFTYSEPRVIADMPNRGCGNPVPFIDNKGRFHLWFAAFYTEGSDVPPGENPHRRDIFYQYSDDLGKTWSEPVIWSDRPGLWVRNALVVLNDGTWLLPINDEETYIPEHDVKWSSRFAYSHDNGETWEFGKDLYTVDKLPGAERGGIIQPSVVQLSDGSLYCMNRSHTGYIVEMRSSDNGKTWTVPKNTKVPNPQCNVCVIRKKYNAKNEDELLLAYNPTKFGRDPMSIGHSPDEGKSWECLFDLRHEMGELSYPCLVQTPDGLIHCTYTLHRLTIAHDVFMI
ncbi:MAG: exo-alpha-sialidase [Promethearchaeota archaeon]